MTFLDLESKSRKTQMKYTIRKTCVVKPHNEETIKKILDKISKMYGKK